MRELSKLQSAIFIVGGILMVLGAGCHVFLLFPLPSACVFLVGAVMFALMQIAQRYDGNDITIRRLRHIQLIADFLFVASGFLMIDSQLKLLLPLFTDYTTYLQYVFNKWVVTLLIAAVLEVYTIHRLSNELNKEKK